MVVALARTTIITVAQAQAIIDTKRLAAAVMVAEAAAYAVAPAKNTSTTTTSIAADVMAPAAVSHVPEQAKYMATSDILQQYLT